jgi:ATP-dependent helicase IRC3
LHASGHADITIASVQSITSGNRIEKFDPNLYKLVLVDEAHHIVSPTYLQVLNHFGLLNDSAKRKKRNDLERVPVLVGVSATFSRFDGLKLGHAIDHIVYHKDYVDMIADKWLCDVIFTTVKTNANLKRVRTSKAGDFLPSALSKAVNTNETNELTVRSWMAKASNRKSTIVFCVDLNHVFGLTAMFRAHGIESHFVTGDTPKKERSATLDAFKNGQFPVLLNCGVFTEGTDIPNIDCVLLARPTKSRNLLVQMIGRGMRLYEGKFNCHIIDFVASLETGIVTTPTLFGLDPEELVDEATTEDMQSKERREREERAKQGLDTPPWNVAPVGSSNSLGNVVFTDYSSIDDLIDDTSGERHIRGLSPYAWVQVDADRFVLSAQSGDYLQLRLDSDSRSESSDPLWTVIYTQKIPAHAGTNAPYRAPRVVATSQLFEHGLRAADTFAADEFPHQFISKTAPWRSYLASEAQMAFINKVCGGAEKSRVPRGQLTKGRAADMITKIKFGARGRFRRQVVEGNIKNKALEKAKKMKEREQVRVGPLSMTPLEL